MSEVGIGVLKRVVKKWENGIVALNLVVGSVWGVSCGGIWRCFGGVCVVFWEVFEGYKIRET